MNRSLPRFSRRPFGGLATILRCVAGALSVIAAISASFTPALAATITQTKSYGYTNSQTLSDTMPMQFEKFDPSLGTLQLVTLSVSGTVPSNVVLRPRYAGDTLFNAYITAETFMEISFNNWTGTPERVWGYGTLNGGWSLNSPRSTSSLTSLPTRSVTLDRPSDPGIPDVLDEVFTAFDGSESSFGISAQVVFNVESLDYPNGLPYVESASLSDNTTTITGDVTVTYMFQPVPEPSTYAMALAGLACGGYSMFRRRNRARR